MNNTTTFLNTSMRILKLWVVSAFTNTGKEMQKETTLRMTLMNGRLTCGKIYSNTMNLERHPKNVSNLISFLFKEILVRKRKKEAFLNFPFLPDSSTRVLNRKKKAKECSMI